MRTLWILALVACSAKIGTPTKSGVVGGATAQYVESGAARSLSSAGASFSTKADPASCVKTESRGACTTLLCAVSGVVDQPSAGTITIHVGDRTVTLAPGADHTYPAWQDATSALFSAGETLSIEASGADVPAFSGTVVAPQVPTIRAPVLPPDGAPLAVARSADLALTWDAAAGVSIELTLSGAASDGQRAVALCSFDGSSGAASVPASALGAVQAGAGSLSIAARSAHEIDVGDYAIQLHADTQANGPDGRRFTAIVALQ
jgi:hypothetical protein